LPTNLGYGTNTVVTLANSVSPTYIKVCPEKDGWNSWFLCSVNTLGQDYILVSTGKNGTKDKPADGSWGPTTDFNADIVFSNGVFVNYPEGVQN
jgi:hypothetical protein